MPLSWPLLILLLPLTVTLLGGRSTWLWLSLSIGLAAVWATLLYVSWDWAQGGTGWPLARLLRPDGPQRAYHDTYYVVAHVRWLSSFIIPAALIGSLLMIRHHPRRTTFDVALFWGAITTFVANQAVPQLFYGRGGMPRRYIDYPDTFDTINMVTKGMTILLLSLMIIATLRPIVSWIRAQRTT